MKKEGNRLKKGSVVLVKKKVMAIILILIMLVGVFFSYHIITEYTHHDCTGEHCPVCLKIEQAVQFISNIRFVPVLLLVLAVLSVITLSGLLTETYQFKTDTLISLKVELLN